MIELNLLPDVKLEYIKAQRSRRLVISLSLLVSVAAVVLLALLLSVNGLQKKHLSDLSKDITQQTATLKNEPQINKILTVQNQLASLAALHQTKPDAAKLADYLNQITPAEDSISNLGVDFINHTFQLQGATNSLSSVNKFVDTLKFTTYTDSQNQTAQPAFSNVVLASFGVAGAKDSPTAVNYSITFAYNPDIFDITLGAKLSVPTTTTTRSGLDNPSDLFKASPTATPAATPKGTTP